jgi:hypothetical protein
VLLDRASGTRSGIGQHCGSEAGTSAALNGWQESKKFSRRCTPIDAEGPAAGIGLDAVAHILSPRLLLAAKARIAPETVVVGGNVDVPQPSSAFYGNSWRRRQAAAAD